MMVIPGRSTMSTSSRSAALHRQHKPESVAAHPRLFAGTYIRQARGGGRHRSRRARHRPPSPGASPPRYPPPALHGRREGLPLCRACLAKDQRAADLREVAFDRGRQLGGHKIARLERRSDGGAMPRTLHSPEPMIMKLSGEPLRRRIRLDVGDDLVLLAAGSPAPEELVSFVSELQRRASWPQFRRQLLHQQSVEQPVPSSSRKLRSLAVSQAGSSARGAATMR